MLAFFLSWALWDHAGCVLATDTAKGRFSIPSMCLRVDVHDCANQLSLPPSCTTKVLNQVRWSNVEYISMQPLSPPLSLSLSLSGLCTSLSLKAFSLPSLSPPSLYPLFLSVVLLYQSQWMRTSWDWTSVLLILSWMSTLVPVSQ